MTEERRYSDFDLLIEGAGDAGYRARVVDSPAGQAAGSFDLPFSTLELENFLLKVGRPRRGARRLESPEMEAARRFGTRLFDAVFQEDLRLSLRRSLDEVERRDEGLRIRLWFSDAPELASLPWEFLYSETDDQFLVLSAWTPIVRYLDLTQPVEPLTVTAPLRILAMISSPHDFPALDVDEEWRRMQHSLQPLIDRGAVVIERTEDATLLELQHRLRRGEYHIFHFLGHGGFDEQADDGVLVLEDGNNRSRLVAGRDLGTILSDHRSLRLAVLNACEGARASDADPFSGVAQSLMRKGIPAVVAMQFEITDDAAITFASEFYGAIADAYPTVIAADATARAQRTATTKSIDGFGDDWPVPVVHETNHVIFTAPQILDGEVARAGEENESLIKLAWDDEFLYIFAEVHDDVLSTPNTGNQIWRNDAVNLNISVIDDEGTISARPDGDDFQLTLSPGNSFEGIPTESVLFIGDGTMFSENFVGFADVSAFHTIEGDYTIEAAIPWATIGLSAPQPDDQFGLLLTVFDNDGEQLDGRWLQAEIKANTPGAGFQDPPTWGTLTLEG